MNSQTQNQIFIIIFVLFFLSTFNPIFLINTITLIMFSHITIKAKITKTSAVLKSVIKKSITTQKEAELSIEEPKQSKAKVKLIGSLVCF